MDEKNNKRRIKTGGNKIPSILGAGVEKRKNDGVDFARILLR